MYKNETITVQHVIFSRFFSPSLSCSPTSVHRVSDWLLSLSHQFNKPISTFEYLRKFISGLAVTRGRMSHDLVGNVFTNALPANSEEHYPSARHHHRCRINSLFIAFLGLESLIPGIDTTWKAINERTFFFPYQQHVHFSLSHAYTRFLLK